MLKNQISKIRASYYALFDKLLSIERKVESLQIAVGNIESRQLAEIGSFTLKDNEFQVFSQWGEDGILDFLTHVVPIKNKIFVEFGVEDYLESNTRYLLEKKNWNGLVLDGSSENISKIKRSHYYWKYNIKAVQAFIDKGNINQLLEDNGISGDIGLLSVDIDGNDFWVWQVVETVQPAIVSVEYNSRLGYEKKLTIPYSPTFSRMEAHESWLFYGASIAALCKLADMKGYDFVGCNSAGVNAFFVRKDLRPKKLAALTPKEGFVRGEFRESRTATGELALLSAKDEDTIISNLGFVDPYAKKKN